MTENYSCFNLLFIYCIADAKDLSRAKLLFLFHFTKDISTVSSQQTTLSKKENLQADCHFVLKIFLCKDKHQCLMNITEENQTS